MAVYLDHNATTPLDDRVFEAMVPFLRAGFGNPSSIHALGRSAATAVAQAREQVAALVGAHPSQVIFTSGGTEANNLALKGVCARPPGRLLISAVEHASVSEPAAALGRCGWAVETAPVDYDGRAVPAVSPGTALVSVMWANNETGVVQDVPAWSDAARGAGAWFHTDAVQAVGKLAVDFAASGAHLMTLSGHKIYGPKGIGALVVDKAVPLEPLLHGGGQEKGRRGGTENVAAIVGFGKAAALAQDEREARGVRLDALRGRFESGLATALPQAVVFGAGAGAERLPNTVFAAVPGVEGQTLIMALDRHGIAVSAGSACGSSDEAPSGVLQAMGIAAELARCAVRFSFGKDNTVAEVDATVRVLAAEVKRLTRLASSASWT